MKKTILYCILAIVVLSTIAGAALNDLIMTVGKDQGTKLMAGSPEFQQAAEMYNILEDPKSALTGVAMEQVCGSAGQELCAAYSIMSNPKSYAISKLTDSACEQDKQLCDAYSKGMQVYGAAQNPTQAAGQYALQEVAKKDPKVGGVLTQAYVVRGYMNMLQAKPGEKGNDAATAANKPALITGKAVADKINEPFSGKYLQESISNCLTGFSLGQSEPQIGDIKNCQLGDLQPTDIAFLFNQKDINAKISGKGCTISKIKDKVYIYNSDSCSWTVDQWTVPKSAKGTYITFDKPQEKIEMTEGRFLPLGEKQEFRFEDRGYEVPQGGILYYKDGKFDLDLDKAETKSFSMLTYDKGQLIGSTKITKLGKDMKIKKTLDGFEITGDASVENQLNKIKSKGKIQIDARGMLSTVGENSDVLLYPTGLKLPKGRELKSVSAPEDVIRISTKNEPVEFTLCEKLDPELPSANICATKDGGLNMQMSADKGLRISHLKAYTAKKDVAMSEVLPELKPKMNKQLQKRFTNIICDYNQALKDKSKGCNNINSGAEILFEDVLVSSKDKKSKIELEIREKVRRMDIKTGKADVTSLGTTFTFDEEKGYISMPAVHVTGNSNAQNAQKKAYLEAQKKTLAEVDRILNRKKVSVEIGDVEILKPEVSVEIGDVEILKPEGQSKNSVTIGRVRIGTPESLIAGKGLLSNVDLGSLDPIDYDVYFKDMKIQSDLGLGNTDICGCRGREETGKPVTITGLAGGEACTANACSVTLEASGIPQEPTIKGDPKSTILTINGAAPQFVASKNAFRAIVQDANGQLVRYYIDKEGSVYFGEDNPYAPGEEIRDFMPLNKEQKNLLTKMCEKDAVCKKTWASKAA